MVIKMPKANSVEIQKARRVDIRPWPLINPTISGMLARWQGLRMTLRMPQINDAGSAINQAPSKA